MSTRFRSRWLLLIGQGFFHLWLASAVWGQSTAVSLTPEKPKWGDALVVKYNSASPQAKLRGAGELYLAYYIEYPDYTDRQWVKMKKDGAVFSASIKVAESSAVYSLYFLSRADYDSTASQTVYISTRAGKPARGASAFKVGNADENYKKYFLEEVALYPDNYIAYRTKWGIDYELRRVRKGVLDGLKAEVTDLRKKVKSDTPELLYALAFGYLVIGQEPESRAYIKQLTEKYPKSPLIDRAISDYESQTNAMQLDALQGLNEMQALKLTWADKYPDSMLARNLVRSTIADPSLKLELLEKITQAWMKAEVNNPLPILALGEAYAVRNVQLAKSLELLTKAIQLTREGYLRLYEDASGHIYRNYLPRLYRTRAEVNLKSKNYNAALTDINTALDLNAGPRDHYYEFRGRVREALNDLNRAEEDYILAYVNGNSQARNDLRALYRKRTGSDKGFQEYLDKKRAEYRSRKSASGNKPAPAPPGKSKAAGPK